MIIAALLGALTFGACVDSQESASVTAIRNAKAEQLKSVATLNNAKAQAEATIAAAEAQIAAAQAQLLAAQAAKVQAEAAALAAETEAQKIANEIAAAQAEVAIAQAEAQIMAIQAKLELDLLKYQTDILNAKLTFNKAMQDLADDEKENLETIFSKYNASLYSLFAMSIEKAELDAEIVELEGEIAENEAIIASLSAEDAQAAWDAAVEAAKTRVTKATSDLAKKEANAEAKAAAVEELRALGAVSYIELGKEVEKALTSLNSASDAKLLATKKYEAAVNAMSDYSKYQEEQYWLDLVWFKSNSVFNLSDIDTDFDQEAVNPDHTVFYPTKLEATGTYVVDATAKPISLFDLYSYTAVKSADNTTTLYQVCDYFYGTHADAVATYEAEVAKYLSTSTQAKALETAKKTLDAYVASSNITAFKALVDSYNANIAALTAQQAAIDNEIAKLNYQISVLNSTANPGYYANQITALTAQITAYQTQKAAIETQKTAAMTAHNTAVASYITAGANLDTYKSHQTAVENATKTYEDLAASYAKAVETLKALAAASNAWTSKYVSAYNDSVVAMYTANVNKLAAEKAYDEASLKYTTLANDYNNASKWGDITFDAPRLSVMLEDAKAASEKAAKELKAAQAELKTAQDNLAAIEAMTEEEIAAALEMTLENMIKYYADAIEAAELEIVAIEAAIVLLEQSILVEEINLENWEAILEDALAE